MDFDLLQAKRVLSARHLAIGFRNDVVARGRAISVREAIATASMNVHAVGVGHKVVDGKVTKERAVRLFVVQKLAPSLIPPRDLLPETIDGIPVDVIESSPAFLTARASRARPRARKTVARAATAPTAAAAACTDNRRKAQRPMVAGISVAHREVTAGTIGYFCRSIRAGDDPTKIYILSNNHVLANVNEARAGDDVYQPGPADGGTAADHVADLRRFQPIDLGGGPNKIDAAIAEILPGIGWKGEICTIGPIGGTERGVEDMDVRKHGRTSGYTEGRVSDESYDALVGMDHNDPDVVGLFQDQMRIEATSPFPAFGLGGDSGSLVVNRANSNAVGLYFAGPDAGEYGIANQISDVLSDLQIGLV